MTRAVHGSETYRTVRCPVRTVEQSNSSNRSNSSDSSNSPDSSDSSNSSNGSRSSNSSDSSNYSNKLFTFASIDVPRLSPAHP